MNKEEFRKLLSQWANEDVYIGQLTWEEGDALAEYLSKWYAAQKPWACQCDWINDANNIQCVACGALRR